MNVLTKALAAYGQSRIPVKGEAGLDWRAEVTKKLLNLQQVDPATGHGYWTNDAGRWMENDRVLVTSYAVLALQIAAGSRLLCGKPARATPQPVRFRPAHPHSRTRFSRRAGLLFRG